jgi:hypothetical protein
VDFAAEPTPELPFDLVVPGRSSTMRRSISIGLALILAALITSGCNSQTEEIKKQAEAAEKTVTPPNKPPGYFTKGKAAGKVGPHL